MRIILNRVSYAIWGFCIGIGLSAISNGKALLFPCIIIGLVIIAIVLNIIGDIKQNNFNNGKQ